MNYKKAIYNTYLSKYTNSLYGPNSIHKIESKYSSWYYYYYNLLPKEKGASILELGCGDGSFIHWLTQLGFNDATGIDISKEQIKEGQRMGIQSIIEADVMEYLGKTKRKFNYVIARDVFEHFEKKEVFEILNLIYDKLDDSGQLLIQVPNGEGQFYTSIYYGDFTHSTVFTEASIKQVCNSIGFSRVNCFPINPVPKGIISLVRYVLWQFRVLSIKFWKMVLTGNSKGVFTQNIVALVTK